MKKILYFLMSVFVLLVGCTNAATLKSAQQLTNETFTQLTLENDDKTDKLERIIFKKNTVYVVFDWDKPNFKSDYLLNYFSSRYGGTSEALNGQATDAYYDLDLTNQIALRYYDSRSKNYDASIGKAYLVFYNPTISAPDASRSSWLIKMEWSKGVTDPNILTPIPVDNLFILNATDTKLMDQSNTTFTLK